MAKNCKKILSSSFASPSAVDHTSDILKKNAQILSPPTLSAKTQTKKKKEKEGGGGCRKMDIFLFLPSSFFRLKTRRKVMMIPLVAFGEW